MGCLESSEREKIARAAHELQRKTDLTLLCLCLLAAHNEM